MEVKYCMECGHWKYDDRIEHKYGEGTGYCPMRGDATGCDRAACMLAIPRKDIHTITKMNVTSVSMLPNGEFGVSGTVEVK